MTCSYCSIDILGGDTEGQFPAYDNHMKVSLRRIPMRLSLSHITVHHTSPWPLPLRPLFRTSISVDSLCLPHVPEILTHSHGSNQLIGPYKNICGLATDQGSVGDQFAVVWRLFLDDLVYIAESVVYIWIPGGNQNIEWIFGDNFNINSFN